MADLIPVVAIVGPTAVGKSALALSLASEVTGEIIGADSRQVYRRLDIGTGKPTLEDRKKVAHHVVDLVDPDEEFSVAHYLEAASGSIEEIFDRGSTPLLVGGTGQYVRALLEGYRLPKVPPDPGLRKELDIVAETEGGRLLLMRELEDLDPVAASRIDSRNVRRVIRAIEVSRITGSPFSEVATRTAPPYRVLTIGVTAPRAWLFSCIDSRVDHMVDAGWVAEVEGLVKSGLDLSLPSMSSLGYETIVRHLGGDLRLDEAIAEIQLETHRFARRQYTWFKPSDKGIRWLDVSRDGCIAAAARLVRGFVSKSR